jgi:putative acetyltransferase
VRQITTAAFGTPGEADLIDTLREQAKPYVSLVAEVDGEIAGHIMFSPVTIAQDSGNFMGLAPMAVAPARQRDGIGSGLVRVGLLRCKRLGTAAIVVLGHPDYYPRFGFVPASRFGICCEYDVPDEVFMALELQLGGLEGISGTARYHSAFGSL